MTEERCRLWRGRADGPFQMELPAMTGVPAALEDVSWRGRVLGTGGLRGATGAARTALALNSNEDDSEGGTR